MPITYNGTSITGVNFNGTTITTVVFNGTTVFTTVAATYDWVFYATSSSSTDYSYSWYFEGPSDDLADMNEIITNDLDPQEYEGDFAVYFCTSDTTYYFFEAVQTS
jgi:hypothetical protein